MRRSRREDGKTVKQKALTQTIDDALAHVEALLAAASGDESRCHAFKPLHETPMTAEQRHHVKIYVESWIEPALRTALILARQDETSAEYTIDNAVSFLRDRSAFGRQLDEAADKGELIRSVL